MTCSIAQTGGRTRMALINYQLARFEASYGTIEQLPERLGGCDTLLLSMRGVPYIDISAAQALMNVLKSMHEDGVDIVLCGLPTNSMQMMHRSGIYDMVGEQGFYWSVERALLDLRPYTGVKK